MKSTTQCAVLTGTGRSAVAVIGVTGPQAKQMLLQCFTPASDRPFSPGEIRFGCWGALAEHTGPNDSSTEAVVVTLGTDHVWEVHCHGGPAAITRIVDDLRHLGAQQVAASSLQWQFASSPESGPLPLVIVEARLVLQACQTARTAAIAMDQVRGVMRDWAVDLKRAAKQGLPLSELHQSVRRVCSLADLGCRLSRPQRVVLSGAPNVGKSSLINAILGYDRSIALDTAGTTRDVLHADTVIDGIPLRLTDTAGIRESNEPIELAGIHKARTVAEEADLLVLVSQPDVSGAPGDWPHPPAATKTLRVLNKADLLPDPTTLPEAVIPTVALSGKGIDDLMRAIARVLFPVIPPPGSPVPTNQRQLDLLRQMIEAQDGEEIASLADRLIYGEGR